MRALLASRELVTRESRESRDKCDGFYQTRGVEIQIPTAVLFTIPSSDLGGDGMARKWGVSKILLVAAVVVFVLAATGVGIGDLNLIALGLALGFASFVV